MYFHRTIESTVNIISETFPILLVTGPRQVGKTTMLQRLATKERKYISLDSPNIRLLAKTEPELFLQRYSPPVIIDEIQYAPELLPFIKVYVDTNKQSGDFWLTGSQAFHMMKNVSESLAGRVGIIKMLGLSNSEINGASLPAFTVDVSALTSRMSQMKKLSMPDFFSRIHNGSMPRIYEEPRTIREGYYESYIATYISRDIKNLTQVADEMTFLKFLRIVAARTATNVNYDALATETGISSPTAKQWLSILISSGLVILVEPFTGNVLKRVIKAPRMYFTDTGLCAHLTRWMTSEALEAGAMSGEFFETWVVCEIYKSYLNNGISPPLYFYRERDGNKKEIDLVIYQNGVAFPVEIKKSSAPRNATKNFSAFKNLTRAGSKTDNSHDLSSGPLVGIGAVICLTDDILPIDKDNWFFPAWII